MKTNDPLNRFTADDLNTQYQSLINKINKRISSLQKIFPEFISSELNPIQIDNAEIKIQIIKNVENKIKENYNNHSQGNLFINDPNY